MKRGPWQYWERRLILRLIPFGADRVPTPRQSYGLGFERLGRYPSKIRVVPLAGIEPALLAELDFESDS
jgi:hypothetical protein